MAEAVKMFVLVRFKGDARRPEVAALVAVIADAGVERHLRLLAQDLLAVAEIGELAVACELGAHRARFQHSLVLFLPHFGGHFLRHQSPVLLDQLAGGRGLEADAVFSACGNTHSLAGARHVDFVILQFNFHAGTFLS